MSLLTDFYPEGAGAGGLTEKSEIFLTSGTWTKPAGVEVAHVFLVGGGGGGVSPAISGIAGYYTCGSGGGGGEVYEEFVPVSGNVTVTVGAGGAASASFGVAASVGGDTSFGGVAAEGGGSGVINTAGKYIHGFRKQPGGMVSNIHNTVSYLHGVGGAGAGGNGHPTFEENVAIFGLTAAKKTVRGGYTDTGIQHDYGYSGVSYLLVHGGKGINGYGGGGAGSRIFGWNQTVGYGRDGGGQGAWDTDGVNHLATAGAVNTGGGGGGGATKNGEAGNAGGAGGSGICIVTWWE